MTNLPRNLLLPDRLAFGLSRAQLLVTAVAAGAGYLGWHGLREGVAATALGVAFFAAGLAAALVPLDGSLAFEWAPLVAAWLPRRRPTLLEE